MHNTTLIVSAFIAGRTDAGNFAATVDLMDEARNRGLNARLVQGRWQGKDELSVSIDLPEGMSVPQMAEHFMMTYQQDAVLVVKDSGECFLAMVDEEEPEYLDSQYVGRWKEITDWKDRPAGSDFTYMGGRYFEASKE